MVFTSSQVKEAFRELETRLIDLPAKECESLRVTMREKCLNKELFLVRIFLYLE